MNSKHKYSEYSEFLPKGLLDDINCQMEDMRFNQPGADFSQNVNFIKRQQYNYIPQRNDYNQQILPSTEHSNSSLNNSIDKIMYNSPNNSFYATQTPTRSYSNNNVAYKNIYHNKPFMNQFNNFSCFNPQMSDQMKMNQSFNNTQAPRRINSSNATNNIRKNAKASLFSVEKEEEFETCQEMFKFLTTDLYIYAQTQRGSRTLQKLLNKISSDDLDTILSKLKNNFIDVMTDTYGNYFIQKLIQSTSTLQRIFILKAIKNDFVKIGCSQSGTHSLQSLIEIINLPEEEELIKSSIYDSLMKLSLDTNGTHVIQKVLSTIPESTRESINEAILSPSSFARLVIDSNGICLLKKFIISNQSEHHRKTFINNILSDTLQIVQSPFGNYVIQHMIDEWGDKDCMVVIQQIIDNSVSLSMQKFSSNVVEKCLDLNGEIKQKILKNILNQGKILSLVKNKYGSYVLEKAISLMNFQERVSLKQNLMKMAKVNNSKEKGRLVKLMEML